MDNNKEQLIALAKIFNTEKVVSQSDIEAVLRGILGLLNNFKKNNEALNSETKKIVSDLLAKIEEYHSNSISTIQDEKKSMVSEFDTNIALLKALIKKVKTIKPRDGVDGTNPNPEDVVPLVMAQIKLPEVKDTVLDGRKEIVEKINTGTKEDSKIELSQIEGSEKLETNILNKAIGILDQRTQYLVNKSVKHDSTLSGSGTDADPLKVIGSTGGGHVIQEEGSDLTQRTNLNFVGTGVTATDDAGNDATVVTINAVGGASAFTDLTDVPSAYTGQGGKVVAVKADVSGLEFITAGAGSGDVIAPATNTDSYIPQWDGANSKTLKDGLAVPAGGLAGLTEVGTKQDKLTVTAVKSANYSANANEYVPCDISAGGFAVTLPDAPAEGTVVETKITKVDTTTVLEVKCSGTDVFNKVGGETSIYLNLLSTVGIFTYNASTGIWYADISTPGSAFAMQFPGVDAQTPITNADISIDTTTRVLTIVPPLGYFYINVDGNGKNTRIRKTGTQTFDAFTDTSGTWYFYFDSNGDPVTTQTAWTVEDFKTVVPIYRILWNATLYNFTITAGNVVEGDTYTNNGKTFTIRQTYTGATLIKTSGTGDPQASGTLTRATGTGDATLTFSAFSVAPRLVAQYIEYHLNDIPADTHAWFHLQGAQWASGFTMANNALTTGTPNADGRNAVIALTTGGILDDNLEYTITNDSTPTDPWQQDLGNTTPASLNATNSALLTCYRQDAAGLVTFRDETRFPFDWNTVTNLPNYITSTGVRTPVPGGDYFVYFVYATQNPVAGSAIKLVSATTTFGSVTNARAYNWINIQNTYSTLNDGEVRPLYRLIFLYNTGWSTGTKKSRLYETQDLRKTAVTSTTVATGSIPASSVTVVPAGNIASTNAQSALEELDAEKQPIDSDLTTIAGLTATTDNIMQSVSSAWASRTPAQVTATLPVFVPDTGAGGVKGLAPATAAGDATKFLKGDGTWATPASGGITNSAGANVIPKSDGTNIVASALNEASAGVFSTTAGTAALSFVSTAPIATTGASQAGIHLTLTASPAVASTDTAGAATGGNITLTPGAAARLTSGNANAGDVVITESAGIGTGLASGLVINTGKLYGGTNGLFIGTAAAKRAYIGGTNTAGASGIALSSTSILGWASGAPTGITNDLLVYRKGTANPGWGFPSATANPYTHTLASDGVGTDKVGSNATITPGIGTGAGTAGNLYFATGDVTTTGSGLHAVTTKMTLLGNGNVGIGTTSPSQMLTVGNNNQFTVSSAGVVKVGGFIADNGAQFGANDPIFYNNGVASPSTNYAFTQNSSGQTVFNGSDVSFRIENATKMFIKNDGNVGIGTASPSTALHVVGTATISSTIELGHATDTTLSRVSAGVVAIEGSNIMTVGSADTVTGAKTMSSIILPAGGGINLTLPTTDAQCTGNYTSSFNAGYSSAVGDLVYFGTGGKWLEVDADAIATCVGLLGIALEAKTDGQAMKVALPGSFVHIDAWGMTVGAVQYAGETLGAIQETIPTGANAVVRVVGSALDADTLAFFPSSDNQTVVA